MAFVAEAKEIVRKSNIFSPDSFWYKEIPSKVALHPKSDAFVKEFLRQKSAYYGNVNINLTSFASPVYFATQNTPKVKVTEWDCQRKGFKDENLAQQWSEVPIPEHAIPAKGSDAEMTVYQASSDTLWEFWRMEKQQGQWRACWGGRMPNASKNEGVFKTFYGTTATSLPFISGQITAEELKRGEINHVMGISLVDIEKFTEFSWPANRSDGYNPNNEPNRIPQGLRFRLDPSINVDKLNLHPVAKTIAKAAQKYGFVIWDKAGAISLRAQNPYSYVDREGKQLANPYDEIFEKTKSNAILDGFPWDKLQFLPMHYGKP